MPQPINLIVSNAKVVVSPDALADKPQMAVLVSQIFATWAMIEQELALMLVRISALPKNKTTPARRP